MQKEREMVTKNKMLFMVVAVAFLAGCAQTAEKKTGTTFFPPLPQQPRLQYLTSISTEEDIGGKKASGIKEWLIGKQPARKQIARAHDVGSSKGRIYILDRTFRKILVLDLTKKELDYIHDEKEGALGDPMGLWVTEDDVKYVADVGRKQLVVYDK
jgi:hypothetical protein